jgi:hypothetical protein
METIQLSVDERVLKKFGEEKIREYVRAEKGTGKKGQARNVQLFRV